MDGCPGKVQGHCQESSQETSPPKSPDRGVKTSLTEEPKAMSNLIPSSTTPNSHGDNEPPHVKGPIDSGPDVAVMHLTTKSSAFINANYEDVNRKHNIYVNTVDADGNLEDVEKMDSPKINLTYQKHSYKSGLSDDLLMLIDTGSVINIMS